MSGPGQGLRSEPTVERRVQKILAACHDAPETLARMNLEDKTWKSDWSFLCLAAPEHCGEYLTATLSDKLRDDRDTLARLLEDTDTYRSPKALWVALDWIRVYDDNEDEFAGVLAKIITKTVENIAEHPDQQAGWDCMAMLVDRFGAAKRTDMLAPPRNIVHLMVENSLRWQPATGRRKRLSARRASGRFERLAMITQQEIDKIISKAKKRLDDLAERLASQPDTLPRMNHQDKAWSDDFKLLMTSESGTKLFKAFLDTTSRELSQEEIGQHVRYILANDQITQSPQAVAWCLDYLGKQEGKEVQRRAVAHMGRKTLDGLGGRWNTKQAAKGLRTDDMDTLELLMRHYDLEQASVRGVAADLVVSFTDRRFERICAAGEDSDKVETTLRAMSGQMLSVIREAGGSLDCSKLGKAPMLLACEFMGEGKPDGSNAVINGLLDAGAKWQEVRSGLNDEDDSAMAIDCHPRVKAERLMALAQTEHGIVTTPPTGGLVYEHVRRPSERESQGAGSASDLGTR